MSDQEAVAWSDADRLAPLEADDSEGLELGAGEPDGFSSRLADLALRLAGLTPESLDQAIRTALPGVMRLLGVDRCGLAQFTSDGRSLLATHGFARPGTPPWRSLDIAAHLPWYTEEVRRGRTHVWPSLPDDLPAAAATESELITALGLRSHVMVPLRAGSEILGCFGVARLRTTAWTPELLAHVDRVASLFADALRSRSREERLHTAEDLNRAILASAPIALLVLDRQGCVTHASDAWTGMSRCAECPDVLRPGTDYLAALERSPRERLSATSGFREGLQSVLDGRRGRFETTYHCTRGSHERDFSFAVTRLGVKGGALIVQTDVGQLERARAELERSRMEVREFKERLEAETACLRKEVFHAEGFDEIVGTSAVLSKVLHAIEQVAAADSPVLILGETGTGKDLAARAIHERSRRRDRPLVPVNCAALPDALIESELFGYERGAFTGAVARTLGRFEAANGGSILLDEIGEMPLGAQVKLLRVLEAGTFERLGSSRTVHVDVRVLAATNRDLEKEVREGRFRADLYYRLNVFPVVLPPLRKRVEDVPLLVWHFINAKQGALGRSIKRVPERLMRAFEGYAWPGNVRELENVIERALIVSTGPTLEVDLPFLEVRGETPGTSLDDVQRAHIEEVLRQCRWKVAGKGNAAERLGVKRGTLQFRMKKLGIQRPESGV